MEEKTFNGYAVPSNTLWITSKPLKRTPESKQHREMREIFATHDLHTGIDADGNLYSYVTEKI